MNPWFWVLAEQLPIAPDFAMNQRFLTQTALHPTTKVLEMIISRANLVQKPVKHNVAFAAKKCH